MVNTFDVEKEAIIALEQEMANRLKKFYEANSHITEKISELEDTIKNCTHPISHIVEGEYISGGDYGRSTPPFRVCTICGYAEEGWYCGYQYLGRDAYSSDVTHVPRKLAQKYVKNMHYQSDIEKWGQPHLRK